MPCLWHCSTNGKLRILVKAQPAPQAPGHCHQLGLAYGRETWAYPTNTLSATVAILLLPDTNLLPQGGITHYSQLLTRQDSSKLLLMCVCFFFSSLTAVPSENQCLSSGAYEWPVLFALKHAVGLSQHWFLLQEWFRESLSKLMACSPTCELHSPHRLILAVYREVHFMPTARSEAPPPMACTCTTLLAPWNGRSRCMHLALRGCLCTNSCYFLL